MNSNQERAVHIHKAELHRRLTPVVEPFLAFVCARNVIRSGERSTILANVQPLDKLTMLLDMLQGKESGWTALLSFLREHDGRMLAASLQRDAGESETQLATATGSNSDGKLSNCIAIANSLMLEFFLQTPQREDKEKSLKISKKI